MLQLATALLISPLALAGNVAAPAGGITWEAEYETTLARAAEENKVVFVAVNMDGERANDRMATKMYKDREIVGLAGLTLNLIAARDVHGRGETCSRFGTIACALHQKIDIRVRENVLKPDVSGYVIAPQHVFLRPDGTVILSVPYEISQSEMRWCFVTALKSVDPEFKHKGSEGRPPRRVILGGVYDPSGGMEEGAPLSREAVLELIKEAKRGLRGNELENAVRRILTSDEPEALDYIEQQLKVSFARGGRGRGGRGGGGRGGEDQRIRLIHEIGVSSPPVYWKLLVEFTLHEDDRLRGEAAVALEQLAAAESTKTVDRARTKEKNPEIEKNWYRALGAAGAADKKARKTLLKASEKETDGILRLNAIVALGSLEAGKDVHARLLDIVRGGTERERMAAAIAMGFTRDPSWIETLESMTDGSEDLVGVRDAAIGVLKGGSISLLRGPLRDVAFDRIERERLFGRAGGRGGE